MTLCFRWLILVSLVIWSCETDAGPSMHADGPNPFQMDDNELQREKANDGLQFLLDIPVNDTTQATTGPYIYEPTDVTDDPSNTTLSTDVTDDPSNVTLSTDVTDTPNTKEPATTDATTSSTTKIFNSPVKLKDFAFWPNASVPFYINTDHFDHEQAMTIMTALSMIAFKTCLKFAPILVPPRDSHTLVFANPLAEKKCEPDDGGHSPEGPHTVVLGYDCLSRAHLLDMMVLRALGLPFEHSRMIRDLYVDVQLENVESGSLNLFAKESRLPPELRNLPYDLDSVLHFGERDFSKNGHKTMIIKDSKTRQHRKTLSKIDIRKLELVYGPECLARDRQEKIEICQNYPNVARRKRSIGEKSLRINPDITPPPTDVKLQDLDVANETQQVVAKVNEIIIKIMDNTRKKYCNATSTPQNRNTDDYDELEIAKQLTDVATNLVENVTKFCNSMDSTDDNTPVVQRRKRDLESYLLNDRVEDSEHEVRRVKRSLDKDLVNLAPVDRPESVSSGSGSEPDQNDPKKVQEEVQKLQDEQIATFEQHSANISTLEEILRSRTSLLPETVPLSKINEEFYEDRRWNKGIVNYFIEKEMDEDAVTSLRSRLHNINLILEEHTCVKLQEVDSDPPHKIKDYLYINDASDFVTGRVGGRQVFGCVELFENRQHRQFTAMMVMAMLGFYFEVARHDRDKYLKVHNRNIRPDKLHHFEKLGEDATLDLPYDFKSATQPAWNFWRKRGRRGIAAVATFKTHDPNGKVMKEMGQNKKLLSEIDIIKINSVYGTKCMDKNPQDEVEEAEKSPARHGKKKHD